MADSKRYTADDVASRDLYKNIENVNKAIKATSDLNQGLKSILRTQKELVKNGRQVVKTVESINKQNKAIQESQRLRKLVVQTEKEQVKLQQELARLDKTSQQLEREKIKNAQELEKLNKVSLQTEQAKVKLQKDVINLEKTRNSQRKKELTDFEKLQKELKELTREFKGLEAAKKGDSKESKILTGRIRELQKEITRINDKARGGTSAFGTLNKNVASLRAGFIGLSQAAGVTLGLFGAFRLIRSSVSIIRDFEKANADLAAVLGRSREDISALTEDAQRLGSITSNTASEITSLQKELAKLGFSDKEILEATEAIQQLSVAAGFGLAESSKLTASALRAFQLDTTETQRVVDVFAKSISTSALDLSFFETALSTVAPVANKFGFSIEETSALLAKLADAGFDASSAATATRNILLNLADSSGDLAKSLGGPARNLDEILEGFNNLSESGIDLAGALELTDKRSVSAFATFLEGTEQTKEFAEALQDAGGTAEKAANEQLNTLDGAIKILTSAWEGFILSLNDGDVVTGTLTSSIKFLADNLTTILKVIGTVAASLVAYRGTVFLITKAQSAWNLIITSSTAVLNLFRKGADRAALSAKSLRASLGFIVGILTLVIPLINSFRKGTSRLAKAQKSFNIELAKEKEGLNNAFKALKETNPETEERRKLIEEINTQYGEYLPNLIKEKDTEIELEKARKAANNELERTLKLKFKDQEINEILNEKIETQVTLLDELGASIQDSRVKEFTEEFKRLANSLGTSEEISKNTIGLFNSVGVSADSLRGRVQAFAKAFNLSFQDAGIALVNYVKSQEDAASSLDRVNALFGDFGKSAKKASKDAEDGTGGTVESIKSLIKIQEALLTQAKKLPEETETQLVVKNREIRAIEKEISRLKALGIEKDKGSEKSKTRLQELKAQLTEESKIREALLTSERAANTESFKAATQRVNSLKQQIELLEKILGLESAAGGDKEALKQERDALNAIKQENLQFNIETQEAALDKITSVADFDIRAAERVNEQILILKLKLLEAEREAEINAAEGNESKKKEIDNKFRNDKLRLTQEFANKELEINEKANEALAAQDRKAFEEEKKRQEERLSLIQRSFSESSKLLDIELQKRKDIIDEEVKLRESAVNRQLELAKAGRDNELADQESALNNASLKRIDQAKKEAQAKEALQLAEAYFQAYIALLKSADSPGEVSAAPSKALGQTLLAKGIATGIVSSLDIVGAFADGVEDFKGKGTTKSDSNLIAFSNRESVVTADGTARNRGLVTALNTGNENAWFEQYAIPRVMQKKNAKDKAAVVQQVMLQMSMQETNDLLKQLNSKPTTDVGVDALGQLYKEIHEGNNKTKIVFQKGRL